MSVAEMRTEMWTVIMSGPTFDFFVPPECYPEGADIQAVLRQPFVGRIRRFCRARPLGAWRVRITHHEQCLGATQGLCDCLPHLEYERLE